MQDACKASLNAIRRFFPFTKVLMCYFNVKDNIRKHRNLMNNEDDLYDIHMSVSES